jgi:hypothetical protein
MSPLANSRPTLVDGRAPEHDSEANRLLVSPAGVAAAGGPGRCAAVVVRRTLPDGSATRLFRGASLLDATRAVERAADRSPPNAVWLTHYSYVRDNWPRWTVRAAERRLAAAARQANAVFIAWTGHPLA